MNSSLHITNGDFTTKKLQQLNINGEIITWREMLCEGKTVMQVGSEAFWKTRFDFLNTSYKVTKRKFIDYTVKEYRNLCQQKQQDEITLWFDNDLFCQVNMLAIISWLKRYRQGRKVTIVQGLVSKNNITKSIANLTENQLLNSYKKRVELTKDDIEYADYIWQLYCSDSPLRLENAYKLNTSPIFSHLEKAIKAHLLRFPSINTGLNVVESIILKTANNIEKPIKSKEQLINTLLKNQETYGFSDVQYASKIDDLKKLFSSFNHVKLTRIGKSVLDNQINYYGKIRKDLAYLGGTKKYSYLYINENDKLLKISS